MIRLLFALLLTSACAAAAAAGPLYSLDQDFASSRVYTEPFRLDTNCVAIQNGGAEGVFAFSAFAAKCAVGATVSLHSIDHGFSGGNNATSWPKASTNDFVIGGAGGSVTGTMYFRFRGSLSASGGPVSGGQRADLMPYITINNNAYYSGGFRYWNPFGSWYTQSWGVLGAGSRSITSIDTVIAITRSWPVNSPFTVEIGLAAVPLSSVMWNATIADLVCDGGGSAGSPSGAGLSLGDPSGLVMSLPSGYALSCVSWNIANNRRGSVAAVDDAPGRTAAFSLAGAVPNPARGARLTFAFALPDGAPATLELLDVAGRRVAEREVGALGAGAHTAELAPGRRVAPGVYLARLTRAGESRVARVAVTD